MNSTTQELYYVAMICREGMPTETITQLSHAMCAQSAVRQCDKRNLENDDIHKIYKPVSIETKPTFARIESVK